MSRPELSEFLPACLAEIDELVALANRQLLALAGGGARAPSPRELREVFRALHTIKGLSAMIDVEPIVALAHAMESIPRALDSAGRPIDPATVELLLTGLREIESRARAVGEGRAPAPPPRSVLDSLERASDAIARGTGSAAAGAPGLQMSLEPAVAAKLSPGEKEHLARALASGRRAVRLDFVPSPAQTEAGRTITTVRSRIAALGELVKIVPLHVPPSESAPGGLVFALVMLSDAPDEALADVVGGDASAVTLIAGSRSTEVDAPLPPLLEEELEPTRSGLVRVHVDRLDETMEALSALIVGRSRMALAVAQAAERGADVREMSGALEESTRQLRVLRASLLRLRMVPVRETLARLPLVLRGLRPGAGKHARLELDDGGAEIDKAVAERVFPAIVHLVRNAIDHAIEDEAERIALGKPREGVVTIRAVSRSSELDLVVEDDGRGIDVEAVARRAGTAVPLSDARLLELLCRPGLSTRDDVTTTSGRGMGMDIVRRTVVTDLGGELAVTSEPGRGTRFVLRVPLSLSITDAFLFECGAQRFAVPVRVVDEIVEIDPEAVAHGPSPGATRHAVGMIVRRGHAVPVVELARRLHLPPNETPPRKALVVRREGSPLAFAVDRLLGQQEIVVRPLDDALVRAEGVAGATDLGDGRPTLVLDLVRLGGRSAANETRASS